MNMDKTNLLHQENTFRTPAFRTLADLISVRLTGCAASDAPQVELHYTTANGEMCLFQAYPAKQAGEEFSCAFDFDPISLSIYQKAEKFQIIARGFTAITHFSLEERVDTEQTAAHSHSIVFTNKNGMKFVPVLQADKKTTVPVSTVPKKVLFVGNSILVGMHMAFGMCASSAKNDYCYHVQQAILTASPQCEFYKLYGSPYEHSSNKEEFEAWWGTTPNGYTGKPAKCSFTEDLDLIFLQLGDNVNTDSKRDTFRFSAPQLLQRIKQLCPKARVIWVHGWYNNHLNHDSILAVCKEFRIEDINIADLKCKENQSSSGHLYTAPDGSVKVVNDAWITHPGDAGMALIAQRIIAKLDL